MSRTARIYRIHELLRGNHRPVPFQRLREALEVSDATIKRDIQFLRDRLGAPLEYDPHANGYHYDERDGPFELPGLWLNHSELYALLAAEQLLEAVQPGVLSDRIGPLRSRIRQLLGDSGADAEDFAQRVRIDRVTSRAAPGEAFTLVADATLARRQLAFHYHGRARDRRSHRRVHPQQLIHYRGNWYLSAWCTEQQALRVFSLDRIEGAEILDAPAQDENPTAHDRHLRSSFGIFTGTAESWAVLRFSPHAARWVADEHWHPDQIGHWTPDGQWELQVPYSDPTELIQEVLRHGPDVEVLAPNELREHATHRLQEATRLYKK
ncbi:helix-turn-helix transcriptional regulator [Arhodomonas sp. AD133]|uniref:helix-turn-helix transcriptional regulator n=1 Tax=Arhodomonas sp. AD133 TaxID=3415009 RepID=UPI003EBF3FD4